MTTSTATTPSAETETKKPLWFFRRGYLQGVFWITLVALTSNLNDILMREASRLPAQEVTFFRYFFAVVTLLPFMLMNAKTAFKTERPALHAIRSLLLFGAIFAWAAAVKLVPLAVMSTFALTVPIFVLPMASVFLKEKVGWQRTLATLVGFAGIFTVVYGSSDDANFLESLMTLNNGTWYLMFAALLFAMSDIVNKKYVSKESNLSMLFYIALGTALFAFWPAQNVWVMPTTQEFVLLFTLGAGGNLILFFLLKAFSATDVSALAPYRYTELFFAGLFGYLFYSEVPTFWTFVGAAIIIVATASIAYYEIHAARKKS